MEYKNVIALRCPACHLEFTNAYSDIRYCPADQAELKEIKNEIHKVQQV